MNKSLLIFKHEFLRKIKSAGFIILTLSVPVLALLGIGLFKLAETVFEDSGEVVKAMGYVDEIGIFDGYTDMGITEFIPFSSRDGAKQALAQEGITEYFVIPEDYLSFGDRKSVV